MVSLMKDLPTNTSWDKYWDTNTDSRFTKVSWSKKRIIQQLKPFIKKGMKVLDAGCGSGFFSDFFVKMGCEVYCLDYSEQALQVARRVTKNKAHAYLNEDLLDPKFPGRVKGKFDLIFSDGLFEHFPPSKQRRILKNLIAVKKKTGIITTFVPNKYSWWEIVRPIFMPGIHEKPFSIEELTALHKKMDLVKSGGINVLPLGFSPDRLFGRRFGMLLYIFAR